MSKLLTGLTIGLTIMTTPCLAGSGYNPDAYNAYRNMQRDMQRPMINPPGPSRGFNYRDNDGFDHRCRQYGNTVECDED